MDEPVNISDDLTLLNGYPDTDSVNVIHHNWQVTVWRDENEEVHILIVDKQDDTQVDLVLGQDGFTQRC